MLNRKKIFYCIPIFVLLILYVVRSYYSYVTGYFVPDEGLYYYMKYHYDIYGNILFGYSIRIAIQIFIFVVSMLLGINHISEFIVIFPIIITLFSVGCLYYIKRILDYLDLEDDYTILIYSFIPIFLLMSQMIITEQIALFFAISGSFYFMNKKYGMSSILFVFACLFRESYVMFIIGNCIYLIFTKEYRKFIFSLISFPMLYAITFPNTTYQAIGNMLGLEFSALGIVLIKTPKIYVGSSEYDFLLDFWGWMYNFIRNVLISHFAGIGIIFILTIIGFYYFWKYDRNRKYYILIYHSIISISISLISLLIKSRYYSYSIGHISSIIRFSHSSIYSVIFISFLFKYKSKWRNKIILSIIIFSCIFTLPFLNMMQSGLDEGFVGRSKLEYRSPYVRIEKYLYGTNDSIIIWAEPAEGLIVWNKNENIDIFIPITVTMQIDNYMEEEQNIFMNESMKYDKIFVYGGLRSNHLENLDRVSWYIDIVNGRNDKFQVVNIWRDEESYFSQLIINEYIGD